MKFLFFQAALIASVAHAVALNDVAAQSPVLKKTSGSSCADIMTDVNAKIMEAMKAPCALPKRPKVAKDCCSECAQHEELSKAVDTSCLNEQVNKVLKAAEEPLSDPRWKEEKKPNKCLSDLVDTHMFRVSVAKAEIAAERPIEQPKDKCLEKAKKKTTEKMTNLLDTTCLDSKVQSTESAAKEPIVTVEAEDKDKKPNKCLSELIDTSCLEQKTEKATEVADKVTTDEEEPCECKVNWGNEKPPPTLTIITAEDKPKADEGCGCKECKEAVKKAWADKLPLNSVEIKTKD